MPLFFQQDINQTTQLGIWQITEAESYFLSKVPLQQHITHPKKRLQHLAGRFLLQYFHPSFPYQDLLIADTRKPFLPNDPFHFSISHCGEYAAAIISPNYRVGVDIELYTEKVHKIKHKFLNEAEMHFVHSYNVAMQTQILTLLWSCKEAMFKWYGLGDVDFSTMLLTQPFELKPMGTIQAVFNNQLLHQSLTLEYQLLNDMCAVWVATAV